MTKERICELERLSSEAIKKCQLYAEAADDGALAFWRGVEMVVDELKMGPARTGSGEQLQGLFSITRPYCYI